MKPNLVDRQIAYKIWVELNTRKLGLGIDIENDVIYEIYNSWYEFFSVTRELIKDIPVSKVKRIDTGKIINISIDVLNLALRPHLTKWQARFRNWYEKALKKDENVDLSPQEIQKQFPKIEELEKDLLNINEKLINYRKRMYEIVIGK